MNKINLQESEKHCFIALSNDLMTLVDRKNYIEILNDGPWHYIKKVEYVYKDLPRKFKGTHHILYLHQYVAKIIGLNGKIDHKDRNPLNNTEENLRVYTGSQNNYNTRKHKSNSTGVKGVTIHKCGKYQAQIRVNNEYKYLGLFNDLEDAKEARTKAVILYHGEFGVIEDV